MKTLSMVLLSIVIGMFTSCNVAEVVIPGGADPNAYEVNGKRKIQWKKKINFGNYQAREAKRSVKRGTNFNFSFKGNKLYQKNKQKHRFQFVLTNTQSKEVQEVMAIHDVNQSNLNRIKEFVKDIGVIAEGKEFFNDIESELNPKDYFVGVIGQKNSNKVWRFGISNVSKYSMRDAFGYLFIGDRKIMVSEAGGFTEGWLPDSNEDQKMTYALHYTEEGQYLGTVRIYGGGKVWIEKGLTPETEEAIAAMSAVFLMKKTD